MRLERAPIDIDERIAMHRHRAVVQRLQRQQFAGRRGQHARHDQVVEDALDVGAGNLRHDVLETHADLVALQVRDEIHFLFMQADRHAAGGVAGFQAGHVHGNQGDAGRTQFVQGRLHDGLHLWVQVLPEVGGQAQAQVRGAQGGQGRVVTGQHGVQQRDVGHAVGDGAGGVAGMGNRGDAGAVVASDGRAQAHGAIERSRQAHRGARVGAQRGRHQARAHGGAATRGRAAGDAFGVVGVAGAGAPRAGIGSVVARDAESQFMHVGLADDDGAGIAQALHDGRVRGRAEVAQGRGAGGIGQAGDVNVVLDGQGHAFQGAGGAARGACGVGGAGLGQGAVGIDGDEGIEILAGGDAVQAGLGQRHAGESAVADPGGGFGDGQGRQGVLAGGVRLGLVGQCLLGRLWHGAFSPVRMNAIGPPSIQGSCRHCRARPSPWPHLAQRWFTTSIVVNQYGGNW